MKDQIGPYILGAISGPIISIAVLMLVDWIEEKRLRKGKRGLFITLNSKVEASRKY